MYMDVKLKHVLKTISTLYVYMEVYINCVLVTISTSWMCIYNVPSDFINIMDVYGCIYKMCTGDYINILDVYGCVYKMCTGGYINILDVYIKCVLVTISTSWMCI